jgi:hypothetical protein
MHETFSAGLPANRALLAAVSAAALMALSAGPALAASPSSAGGVSRSAVTSAASAADDGLPTTEEEKVKAAREIGVEPDNEWLAQTDRNFVFKIWQHAADYPVIRDAAELVLAAQDDIIDAASGAFIRQGILDAKKADDAKKISEEIAARQARDLKRAAYAAAGLIPDSDGRMLLLSERDAVIEIFTKAAGTRVKAAAEIAVKGNGDAQHAFLVDGVKAAAEQDVQDAIKAADDNAVAEKARLARESAMRSAAAVLGVVADAGKLAMTDDNFVRWIWETVDSQNRPQVRAAAERALRSSDPAAWRAFIDTGIHTANRADLDDELAKKEAADRRLAEDIKAKAATAGLDNVVTAATQALAAGGSDLDDFIRIGQYQVPSDNSNRPGAGGWQWRNVHSGSCLGIAGGTAANGAQLTQSDCGDGDDRLWLATRTYGTDSDYRIVSAKDRTKCVSLAKDSADNGTSFVVRTCDRAPDQTFTYKKVADNYIWVNQRADKAITVIGGTQAVTGDVDNSDTQQWYATNTRLLSGQPLEEARVLHSGNGSYTLLLRGDGNLVLSKGTHTIWTTKTTDGARLINQPDGNLALLRADNTLAWSTNTAGKGPGTLRVDDNGDITLSGNGDGKATWGSGTDVLAANLTDFRSSFDAGAARMNWRNAVDDSGPGRPGAVNVGGFVSTTAGPEVMLGAETKAHSGTGVLLYSGRDNSTTASYAYAKAFSFTNTTVLPDTTLSYWIYPQSTAQWNLISGGNSTCGRRPDLQRQHRPAQFRGERSARQLHPPFRAVRQAHLGRLEPGRRSRRGGRCRSGDRQGRHRL